MTTFHISTPQIEVQLNRYELESIRLGLSLLYDELENELKNGLVNNLDNEKEIQKEMNRIKQLKKRFTVM
jgi:hypothetical protein